VKVIHVSAPHYSQPPTKQNRTSSSGLHSCSWPQTTRSRKQGNWESCTEFLVCGCECKCAIAWVEAASTPRVQGTKSLAPCL